jgi:predicted Zn-dependent peptidase
MPKKKEIITYTFPNGFKVVYQKSLQSLPITTIYTFCKVGSAYETDKVRGASHFVEHMCFKGTHKREEARDILKQYDEIGAFFNAYTEKRFTAYMVKCDDKYVHHCSEILGDMLMNSMFPRKEFDKEQKVVVEESIKGMNDDEYMLQERMDQIIYRGSSYQYSIDCLKYHPSATFLQYSDIFEWYHWFYHPSNMIFSIVSNLSFSTILSMLKKTAFVKKDRHSEHTRPAFVLEKPILALFPINIDDIKEKHVKIEFYQKKGVSTNILNIAFRTCPRSSPDKYALNILKHILNGLSGKLFTALRTKHGLTYNSVCLVENYEHTGYLAILIQTDPSKIIKDRHHIGVLPIVIDLLRDLKKKGVTTEDIQTAKGNIQGKYLLSMQSMDNMTEYNGMESVYQESESDSDSTDIVPYSKIYDTFLADLSKKDIQDIIQKYLIRENMVIGIMYETGINKKKIQDICDVFV